MKAHKKYSGWLSATVLAFPLLGCATTSRNAAFADVDALMSQRKYAAAADALSSPEGQTAYKKQDAVLFYLDVGMLQHLAANHEGSTHCLDEAERLIEANFSKSVSSAAASFLLNDTVLEYSDETYEDLYINVFKALDYAALDKFDDAFVEIHRVGDKLNALDDKYGSLAGSMNGAQNSGSAVKAGKTEFHDSALAHYLSFILYRADGKDDDAELEGNAIDKAFESQPHIYNFTEPARPGLSWAGNVVPLDIIGFTGNSPIKRARTIYILTQKDGIVITSSGEDSSGNSVLQGIQYISSPGIEAGYNFKCQLPEMFKCGSKVERIMVSIDGKEVGDLSLLESLENAAIDTYKLKEPIIYIKTIIRTAVKGVLAAKAKDALKKNSSTESGAIASLIGGIALDAGVNASEAADLRSARYFPARAYVGEFFVEPGVHRVELHYYDGAGKLVWADSLGERTVRPKGLNLVSAYALF
jgi:uncharacterized protein